MRAGLRLWLGLKVMTVLAAVHLAYMASSQLKVMGIDFITLKEQGGTGGGPIRYAAASAATSEGGPAAFFGLDRSKAEKRPLKWAIFTPPKPFSKAPHQLAALRSWQGLRVPPAVFLIEAADLDPEELARIREEYGVRTIPSKTNSEGFLLQNEIFERASQEQDMDVVVVLNSDIILGDDFLDALEHVEATFERFLMVGARYDNLTPEPVPADADAAWLEAFRERTLRDGALHTYGGSDYFAWRPVGDPSLAAVGGRIPPFTYGRGKADNWIIEMAVRNGVVEVVDASTAAAALHPAHGYANVITTADAAKAQDQDEAAGLVVAATERKHERDLQQEQEQRKEKKKSRALAAAEEHDPAASGKYVNFWSAKSAGDPQADMNKYLAYTFGHYENGEGTPLHAPWQLMRCVEAVHPGTGGGDGGYQERPCLRYRVRPAACPCEHASAVARTLTEVETAGHKRLCGKEPAVRSEAFGEDFAFRNLIGQQAEDRTVVLLGFNNGYQDMLLNMVCRLGQLGVSNYVIAAFDAEAFAFCRRQVLPCFPVSAEVARKAEEIAHPGRNGTWVVLDDGKDQAEQGQETTTTAAAAAGREAGPKKHGAGSSTSAESAAQAFGTQGFRALTKLKSQQVLRILELGYNVVWSDVDIFWKVNTIPGLLAEMGEGVDIGIQSNAPPQEAAENGHRRINSGFYYARATPAATEAFRQIVAHARQSKLSEQPSFYTVLCGDDREYVAGTRECANTAIPVRTKFLPRDVYPNGAMVDVVRGVTPASADGVAIVHFNWLEGHDAKVQSFVDASMWLLDPASGVCMYDSKDGVAPALHDSMAAAAEAEAEAAATTTDAQPGQAALPSAPGPARALQSPRLRRSA